MFNDRDKNLDDYEDEYEQIEYEDAPEDDEDENALWDDEDTADTDDADEPPVKPKRKRKQKVVSSEQEEGAIATEELPHTAQWQLVSEQIQIEEAEADKEEHPFEDDEDDIDEQPERKLLKRKVRALALKRLEDSARTVKDYENIAAWYDRLDANRERRERYHELYRSGDDVPLDYGASADGLYFPDTLNNVLEKQIRKGDFIDAIFYCPYDIHELVTEEYMSAILRGLTDDHKFLLFLCALRQYSSARIAAIRGQTDRNIRKVRGTMLKKIRKKLLAALTEKHERQQPMTLLEKVFLADNGIPIDFKWETQYNDNINSTYTGYNDNGGVDDEKPV